MADDPKELYGIIERIAEKGKIAKGINEVTKQIEKGNAKAVIVAQDIDPKEIIMHIPALCKEKGITYIEANSKSELGKAAKLPVGTSSLAILDYGDQEEELNNFAGKTEEKS